MANKQKGYLGNPNLKEAGIDVQFTDKQVTEYIKCANDPAYFIKKYIKIVSLDEGLVPFNMYDFQEDMIDTIHNNRFVIAKLPRQTGKALSLDTPINTPLGWKTMGEIEIGDEVYGADGKPTNVIMATDVMHNHECYEVEFDNGEIITADKEHLWNVECSDWSKTKTITTEQILEYLPSKLPDRPIYINIAKSLEKDDIELPIQPYTLGVWLGDGYSSSGRYISEKNDNKHIKKKIINEGYDVAKPYQRDNCEIQTIYNLQTTLKECDVFENKRIPRIYFDSSIKQRLELLRGLMDTDGYCDKGTGSCEFYQKSFSLITEVRELISGLGMKSRISSKNINGQVYYTIIFSNKIHEVFSLPRKATRQKLCSGYPKNNRHYIRRIEKTNSVPVRCIQVDNEDKLFLCGRTMIPTHNSTTMISYILHYVLFNQSMSVAVLANKQTVARDILGRLQLAYEYLPLWLQQGIIAWNKGSIELENGSKIIASSTSSSTIRGGSYNFVMLDEFAHVPNNIAEDFFSSVYPTISSGKNTKIIMISTPNGLNMFYYYWRGANKKVGTSGKNDYVPFEVHWSQVPGRDEKWKEETIKNTSKEQFEQEMECSFLGSQHTLIKADKLRSLSWREPEIKNPDGLWTYEKPKPDHDYFITVDTSRGQGKDYSAFVVIDTTQMPYKMVAKYRNNIISPMVYPTAIKAVAEQYNKAQVLVEINDIGGQVADVLHEDLEYDHVMMAQYKGRAGQTVGGGFGGKSHLGVRTTGPVKKLGCSILKSLIEEDKLLVEDMDLVGELTTFIAKRNSFEADDGHTDDLVMCLVLFSWLTRQPYFKELTDTDVRVGIYEDEIDDLEENIAPFGFVSTEDAEVGDWDGEDRWFSF